MTTNNDNLLKPLYHYTSIHGLIGILTEKKIWATSIFHLNDKEEFYHGREMFLDALKNLKIKIEQKAPKPELRQAVGPFATPMNIESKKIKLLNSIIFSLKHFTNYSPIYVCSFSKNDDQLSQWRGYCPNAIGFSIGFNFSKLNERIKKQNFSLVECIYKEELQKQLINEHIESHIESEIIDREETEEEETIRMFEIHMAILKILPRLKHKAFEQEKEWRLICHLDPDDDRIKYRPGKTVVIPYFEFDLGADEKVLPIESITIGPTPNKEESYKSIVSLKKTCKLLNLKINKSETPYREI